ncbi:MAG: SurA N-terminal domain-containing protein [Candidatus Omnitrophota bacterium]
MLQIFSNKERNKKIMVIIFICILPGFLLWGTASVVKSVKQKPLTTATIFNKRVSSEAFAEALQSTRLQTMMQFGESFSQVEKFLDFNNLALERLILLHECRIQGLSVSDDDVRRAIAENPAFQRRGAFDPGGYEYMMRYVLRVQPRAFEEMTRQNLIMRKLFEKITAAITAGDQEMRLAYEKQNEQISISYIAGIPAEFLKNAAPQEDEIKDYFSKNETEFKEPISFNLEYLTFDTEPQAVGASQILEQKDGFDKTAKEMNLPVAETGFFAQTEPIPGLGYANDMTQMLPKMQKGDMLPIRQIDSKYYAFRIKEIKEPFIPTFEAVKDKIKEILSQKKAKTLASEKINAALARLQEAGQAGAADFDKISSEFGLKSSVTDPFKFGSYIQGIGASDEFFTKAKELKDNQFSSVIEIPSGFYIIRTKNIIPIDETKYLSEKDAFNEKFLSQKKQDAFGEFIKEIKKKATGAK